MKTFGPEEQEVLRDRGNLYNEDLHNLHFSSKNFSSNKQYEIDGTHSTHGEEEKCIPGF